MLIDLITRLSGDTKYDVVRERAALVKLANQGAKEVYRAVEVNDLMRECILLVPPNKQVAIPYFVGYLKGMREFYWYESFDLHSIATPRYTSNDWGKSYWRNWRDKGQSPVHTFTNNMGSVKLNASSVETPNVVVTITGTTAFAARKADIITIGDNQVVGTQSFSKIQSIYSPKLRSCDIVITDTNDVEIAVLYNNQQFTRYRIVDVSMFPFAIVNSASVSLVNVLYKVPYNEMLIDTDEALPPQFEDAVYYKCMELWSKVQEGKENATLGYYENCAVAIRAAKKEIEGGERKVLSFEPNPLYGLHRLYSHKYID